MTFKLYYEAKENSEIISHDIEVIRNDHENFKKIKADIEGGSNILKTFKKYFPNLQYLDYSLPSAVIRHRVKHIGNKLGLKYSGHLTSHGKIKRNVISGKKAIESFTADGRLSINYDLFVNLGYLDEFVQLYINWPKPDAKFIEEYFPNSYSDRCSAHSALRKFINQYYKHTGIKLQSKYHRDSPIHIYKTIAHNYLDEFLIELKEEIYREQYESMLQWFFAFCRKRNIYLSPASLSTDHFTRLKQYCISIGIEIDIPKLPHGTRAFKNPGKKPRTNELGTPGNFPKQFRQITPPNSSSTPPSNYKHGGNAPKDNNFPST
jgi:hypothetical protein